ncbi:hypothetical protein L873DRAFT_1811351 [Choiromyces venosus 120613-1]|uniref:Uncharacterized protein n=1 Tax=Choiromyces venosus 120613-1 TaxID=1336337 RepID=A0A3N4JHL7_9PEZI|nr:hypothetical protein L873DRAFT_1811351 [Choiromyces venosus 120613-1]
MRFNLASLLALYFCCGVIGAFAIQRSDKAVVGVCPSYFVQEAIFPGGTLEARASVGCGNCAPGQKCCEPKNAAPFCVPEDASCCGRTWCSAGHQCCEYDDSNGGCCPAGGKCAIGGRGCCKEGESCFGPFSCHDFGSTECTMGEVDYFLCCNAAHPHCRWDPSFGYGCFNTEGIQSVISSKSTNAPSAPSTTETRSQATATGTSTSSSGSEVVTSVPSTLETTREGTQSLPVSSLTLTLPGTFSATTGTNMTTSSGSKRSSSTKGSTTTTGTGTTVTATGTASPSETSTAIGAGFADLSKGLGWGTVLVWLAGLLVA